MYTYQGPIQVKDCNVRDDLAAFHVKPRSDVLHNRQNCVSCLSSSFREATSSSSEQQERAC